MPSANPAENHRLYVAFQGGGAKGLVHVGALKALEERKLTFRGLSGTSAGAIVAALKAVGYTADDLVNTETGKTILAQLKAGGRTWHARDLFGPRGWARVRRGRRIADALSSPRAITAAKLVMAAWLFACLVCVPAGLWRFAYVSLTGGLMVGACAALVLSRLGSNLSDLSTFRDRLDELLTAKFFEDQPGRRVQLRDLAGNGGPALKIIASDLSNQTLKVFSSNDPSDGDVYVSDAVAASVCIPLIFRPWMINDTSYLDGGLVSNLPAWPFDEERLLDPDATTVAVEIGDSEPDKAYNGFGARKALADAVKTALFGASVLNTRAVPKLAVITLPTDIKLLEFDAPLSRVRNKVSEAYTSARAQITKQIFEIPKLYMDACELSRNAVTQIFDAAGPILLKTPGKLGRIRVSVAVQEEGCRLSLRLRYCLGFEHDADEDISLPIANSLVGEAWRTGNAVIRTAPFPAASSLPGPEFRKHRRLFAPDINWILAVPIYSQESTPTYSSTPAFVVAVDGSDELVDDQAKLAALATVLRPELETIFSAIAASHWSFT